VSPGQRALPGLDFTQIPSAEAAGQEMFELMRELFPIPRSLTGDGVRATLAVLGHDLELNVVETPSGTAVFDWTVPREWNVREAYVEGPDGERVVDFARSPLHLLGYSVPVDATLSLDDLEEHVYTHENPDLVPYRTSYHSERWGFCMSRRTLDGLSQGSYHVRIDATLADGSLTYGEAVVPGSTDEEFLVSTHVCHPALANDNLSGVVLTWALARALRDQHVRHTYRFLWSPGTLGPLCWLHHNRATLDRVQHGIAISSAGDPGPVTYKRSRRQDAHVDRAAAHVLRTAGREARVVPWFPYGGDERQFCSPGFDLPVGAFSRTPADAFPEYHSSADDLDFVQPWALADSFRTILEIVDVVESDATYVNLAPYGEPFLGKRGLYRPVGGESSRELALLWVLSLCDGTRTLLEVAEQAGLPFTEIRDAALALAEHDLLGHRG
jgi:aminopeptidase-like protein